MLLIAFSLREQRRRRGRGAADDRVGPDDKGHRQDRGDDQHRLELGRDRPVKRDQRLVEIHDLDDAQVITRQRRS